MTNTELKIMLDAATYLGAHSQPPPNGTDAAVDWWMDAAADIGAIAAEHTASRHRTALMQLWIGGWMLRRTLAR